MKRRIGMMRGDGAEETERKRIEENYRKWSSRRSCNTVTTEGLI